jgi:hypothetical protein
MILSPTETRALAPSGGESKAKTLQSPMTLPRTEACALAPSGGEKSKAKTLQSPAQQQRAANRQQRAAVLRHMLEVVMELGPNSQHLAQALADNEFHSIYDVMMITDADMLDMESTIPSGYSGLIYAFQCLVRDHARSHDSTNDDTWTSLTAEDFAKHRPSTDTWTSITAEDFAHYLPSISADCSTLAPVDGEKSASNDSPLNDDQYQGTTILFGAEEFNENGEWNYGEKQLFNPAEDFNVDEFLDAMVQVSEATFWDEDYIDEDNNNVATEPTNDLLEASILFFEEFCLLDDFLDDIQEHSISSISNNLLVPSGSRSDTVSATSDLNGMTILTNKEDGQAHQGWIIEASDVHIEYPDRTKFVSSMNDNQKYQERMSYNNIIIIT